MLLELTGKKHEFRVCYWSQWKKFSHPTEYGSRKISATTPPPPPTECIRAKLGLPPPQMDVGPYAYGCCSNVTEPLRCAAALCDASHRVFRRDRYQNAYRTLHFGCWPELFAPNLHASSVNRFAMFTMQFSTTVCTDGHVVVRARKLPSGRITNCLEDA